MRGAIPRNVYTGEKFLSIDFQLLARSYVGGGAQREKTLSLNALGVREAVSGRGRPKRRLKAFALL